MTRPTLLLPALALTLGLLAPLALSQQTTKPAAPTTRPSLAINQKAPDIDALTLDSKPITLTTFAGKPLVLQFGSISEPLFRARVASSEKLAEDFAGKAAFVILYQRESHPSDGDALEINADENFNFTQPVTLAERLKLATMARDRLKIKNQTLLVDTFADNSSQAYGSYPNMTFIITADGKLAAGYPWADPKKIKGALDALLANKPIPEEFQGPKRASTIPALTISEGAMEMSGAGQGIAAVLDDLKLTDKQRTAIYPPLTQYLADLRNLRELRAGEKDSSIDPAELKTKIEELRAANEKLRTAIKENLSDKDAAATLSALDNAPGSRLLKLKPR